MTDEVRNLAMMAADAANAKGSASASEEMNAQAEQLKEVVSKFKFIV